MPNSFHDLVIKCDHAVWYFLNVRMQNPFFDLIIPFVRNQYFWTPLYLFLAIYMPYKFGKRGWMWCAAFIITFALSDQIVVEVIKPFFQRVRPCRHPVLSHTVHLLVECGSGFSFPSAHAANHFSMGLFSAMTIGKLAKWIWPVALGWALLVAFAQVYVGVHFPLDVSFGGSLGAVIGIITGWLFNKYFNLSAAGSDGKKII